jgi:hypothetical protein
MTAALPQAIEAERSILGGILLESRAFHEVGDVLTAEDFSLDAHRRIWRRMAELAEDKSPIDVVTLIDSLDRGGDLRAVGDAPYIASLLDGIPDRPSYAYYARLIKDASTRRAMIACFSAIVGGIEDGEATSLLLESAKRTLDELSEARFSSQAVPLFENYSSFEKRASGKIDWMVDGLIQRGANGLVLAGPKSGKSLAVADLAIALAAGQPWLDFDIPQRVRVGVVSREDYWALTHSRMRRYRECRAIYAEELDNYLWVNGRGAHPSVMLDRPDDVSALIAQLKKQQTEFLIFDVMRVLHSAEENDSTEMQAKVINPLNRIAEEVGCSICMIHHSAKETSLAVSRNARGSSGIFGWAEFTVGIRMVDEESRTREFECQIKAADAPQAFHWRAIDVSGGLKLERVNWTPPKRGRKAQSEEQTEF